MEDLFGVLAIIVLLAAFPGGFFLARRLVKGTGGRIVVTVVLGVIFIVGGLIAIMAGCSALGGKVDFK
jgi:hypothetical protein